MKNRYTEPQIIGFLKEAHAGALVKELCRRYGFRDAALYGWAGQSLAACRWIKPCAGNGRRVNA
jgi:putative transposase